MDTGIVPIFWARFWPKISAGTVPAEIFGQKRAQKMGTVLLPSLDSKPETQNRSRRNWGTVAKKRGLNSHILSQGCPMCCGRFSYDEINIPFCCTASRWRDCITSKHDFLGGIYIKGEHETHGMFPKAAGRPQQIKTGAT